MRLFLTLVLFVFSFSASIFGQTEAARADYEAATMAARDGDFDKASLLYRSALAKLPRNAERMLRARITFNIGVALYHTGHIADAIPFYERAIEISEGKYARVFYALGIALKDLGNLADSANAFEKCLQITPRDGEAWFDLGLARYGLGDLTAAKNAFEKAFENGTVASADALNNIGVVMAKLGNMPGAISSFEAALRESEGKNVEALANLRVCRGSKATASLTISNTDKIQEKTNE